MRIPVVTAPWKLDTDGIRIGPDFQYGTVVPEGLGPGIVSYPVKLLIPGTS